MNIALVVWEVLRRAVVSTHRRDVAASAGMAALVGAGATYSYRRAHRPLWSPPRGRSITAGSLRVRVRGEAGAPILLLHGLIGSGRYWGGAYDHLSKGRRLVVPDLLGFGDSRRPEHGYGPDDHVDAVVACLDAIGVDEPVAIRAHSLGGLIGLRLAATHPDRVSSIVAFGPPIYPGSAAARAHVTATGPMSRLFVFPGHTAERACRWVCGHRAFAARVAMIAHPSLPYEIASDGVQHTWSSYSETLRRVILDAEAPVWLDSIRCPVLFVTGDSDPVVDRGYLRGLPSAYDNVELRERPGGHDLPLTHPADCSAMIETALRSASR